MCKDILPDKFKEFTKPVSSIMSFNPTNISIVGSYGNHNKYPNKFSDIDLIFVFETNDIYKLYSKILTNLQNVDNLVCLELGVHYQFGYTLNIYFRNNSCKWIDVGIMDCHFATNYMINLPKKDVYGSFKTQKNKQIPSSHINQLGRKILNCIKQEHVFNAKILAYRYLDWLKVENDIKNIKEKNCINEDFFNKNFHDMNDNEILSYVLEDIKNRKL